MNDCMIEYGVYRSDHNEFKRTRNGRRKGLGDLKE